MEKISVAARPEGLAAFLAILFVATLSAQKNQANSRNATKYDLHTEAKMKGVVEELKLPPKDK